MPKRLKIKPTSVIIGIYLGALAGYISGLAISKYLNDGIWTIIIPIIIGAILGTVGSVKDPILTERIAFVFSAFVFLQSLWDYSVADWNSTRTILFISALLLFILNSFTGRVRKLGFKVIKKQSGL